MKTPAAVFLSSSPLKNSTTMHDGDELDSPTKHGVTFGSSPIAFRDREEVEEEKMTLQPIAPNSHIYPPSTPPRSFATVLRPSPALQTTPGKKSLSVNTQSNVVAVNPLLRTPTQPSVAALHAAASGNAMVGGNGPQTDNEGADLLMYLATSPSPAKAAPTISFLGATPRSNQQTNSNSSKSNNTTTSTITNATNNNFIAPAPPLTPKRPIITTARTPQNRLTPLVNLNSATGGGAGVGGGVGGGGGGGVNGNGGPPGATGGAGGGGLPSSGLMLTPAGFNMSDYFNFFTPLPGGGSLGHNLSNKFLKTPDLHNHLLSQGNSSLNQVARQKVDGKMINFDKVGLFGGNDQQKEQ